MRLRLFKRLAVFGRNGVGCGPYGFEGAENAGSPTSMFGSLSEYAQRVDQVLKGSWFRLNPTNLAVIAKQPICAADSRPFTRVIFGDSKIEGKP